VGFSKDWWITTLPIMVRGFGGFAMVRVRTYSGNDYLVRDVLKTHEGTVTLNVYSDARGNDPILSSSSNAFDFDIKPIVGYRCVAIPFENIEHVAVDVALSEAVKFH
jgi:hypothetical protein